MFEGVCKPHPLADAFRWLYELTSDASRINLKQDGWLIPFVDPSHVIAGEVKVNRGYFKEYKLDEEFTTAVDGWRLHDMLKAFEKKELVKLEITKDKTVIENIPAKGKGLLVYQVKNLDPEFTRKPPDLTKPKDKASKFKTTVFVPIEVLREERKKFKKEHPSFATQLFLIGYNGETGVIYTGESEDEKPVVIHVKGEGEKGFVVLSSNVLDSLLKWIPRRVKTLTFRVGWGDIAHVMFAFDPKITVDAYVAPYLMEEDDLAEWLAEAGFKKPAEAEVKPVEKPKPEKQMPIPEIMSIVDEVLEFVRKSRIELDAIERKYNELKDKAEKATARQDLWHLRQLLIELNHRCAAILHSAKIRSKLYSIKESDLEGRPEDVVDRAKRAAEKYNELIDDCQKLKKKIDDLIEEVERKYKESESKQREEIQSLENQIRDLTQEIGDKLSNIDERYKVISADVKRIYEGASREVKPHHINNLRSILDDLKDMSDKLSQYKTRLKKKVDEVNTLMEKHKEKETIVNILYDLLGELTNYEKKIDRWLNTLKTDRENISKSLENLKKELEKAEAKAREEKKKVEVEEVVKDYADQIKQIREDFNKLKEQFEILKKMNIEMIDYDKVKKANFLGNLEKLAEMLKDIESKLREIYKKIGLVYADNLANEAESLRKTIESYHKENIGWLAKKMDEFVDDFLKSKGITSKAVKKWMLREVYSRYLDEEKIPKTQDLNQILQDIISINKMIYTDKRKFLKYIADDVRREVKKSTGLTYYIYDPSDLKIEVDEDFIDVESKPVYGVTYGYSYPRLSVEDLRQLGIEPNPKRWVAPPLGWKPEVELMTEEEMLGYMNKHLNEHYIPVIKDLIQTPKLTDKQKKLVRSLYQEFDKYLPKQEYDTLMKLGFILKRHPISLSKFDQPVLNKIVDRAVEYGMKAEDRHKLLTFLYRYRRQLADPNKLSDTEIKFMLRDILPYAQRFTDEFPDLNLAIGQIKEGLKTAIMKPEEMPYVYRSPRPLTSMAFPAFFKDLDERGIKYVVSEDGFEIGTEHPIPLKYVDELELKLVKTPEVMRLVEFADYYKEGKEAVAKAIVESSRQDLLHDVREAIKGTKTYNRYMVESSADALRKEAEEHLKEIEKVRKVEEKPEVRKPKKPPEKQVFTDEELRVKTISEISKLEAIHNIELPEDIVRDIVEQVINKLRGVTVSKEEAVKTISDIVKRKFEAHLKEIKMPEKPTPEKIKDIIAGEMAIASAKYDVKIPENLILRFTAQLLDKAVKLKTIEEVRDFISREVDKWVSEHADEWKAKPEISLEEVKKCVEAYLDTIGAAKFDEIMQACHYPREAIEEVLDFMVDQGYRKIKDYYLSKKAPSEDEILRDLSLDKVRLGFILSFATEHKVPPRAIEVIVNKLIEEGKIEQEGKGASAIIRAVAKIPKPKVEKPKKPEKPPEFEVKEKPEVERPKPEVKPEIQRAMLVLRPVLVRYEALCRACSFAITPKDIQTILNNLHLINKDKLVSVTRYLLSCRILPTNAQKARQLLTTPEFTRLASEIGITDEVEKKLEEIDTVLKLKEARVSTAALNAFAKTLTNAIKSRTYIFDLNKLCTIAQFTDLLDDRTRDELRTAISTMQPPTIKAFEKRYEDLINHECFETLKSILGV